MRIDRLRRIGHVWLALTLALVFGACGDDGVTSATPGDTNGSTTSANASTNGTTSGTNNGTTSGCTDTCPDEGATQCDADGNVETCAADAAGCLAWSATETCGAAQTCAQTAAGARCACDDVCEPGTTSCDGTILKVCLIDADGCGVDEQPQDCAALVSTGECSEGDSAATCVEVSVPIAAPEASVTLSGRMRAESPNWARPLLDCTPGEDGDLSTYGAFTLVNTQNVAHTLTLTPDWEPTGDYSLYAIAAPLNPDAPAEGCIAGSDGVLSEVRLEPGASVVIVASTELRRDADYTIDVRTDPAEVTTGCDGATIEGVVTFDNRAIDQRGLGPVTASPVEGATVVVLRDGEAVERVQTAPDGSFCSGVVPEGQEVDLRIVAEDATSGPQEVVDFTTSVYAVRVPAVVAGQGQLPIHIGQDDNAGAFAILNTMGRGLRYATEVFARDTPWPTLTTYWEYGNWTPGGTSYFDGQALWILGGPEDTDEYDTPVLLHELGHYLQGVYDCTDGGVGSSHAGADTDPRLAWSEGWATHFANLAANSSLYLDSYGDQIALDYDMAALPASGEYAGRPREDMTQTLSEWLIAASMWRLYQEGPADVQAPRMMTVIRDWFGPLVTDRGIQGADFVDYLDGYLCIHGGEDQAFIADHIVGERTFPYDFGGSCPLDKPGRPRLAQPLDLSAQAKPNGQLVYDHRGRLLREVTLAPVKAVPNTPSP